MEKVHEKENKLRESFDSSTEVKELSKLTPGAEVLDYRDEIMF